jgi:hypothetical protein
MQRESTLPILLWFLLKFGIWPGLMQIKSFQQRRGGSRLDVVGASISRFFYCNDLPGSEKAELIDRATGFTACAANSMLRSSRTGNRPYVLPASPHRVAQTARQLSRKLRYCRMLECRIANSRLQ